jgi:hypothetical protein
VLFRFFHDRFLQSRDTQHMASFDGPRLSLEAYNHDLKVRFFRHKQRGKARRIGVDDDARRRYLHKAMRRYYHKAMIKPSGLQWLEGQEWRYMSESDDDDDDDNGDGDGDGDGDGVDTTPTPTPTWQCVGRPREFKVAVRSGYTLVAEPVSCIGGVTPTRAASGACSETAGSDDRPRLYLS